MHYRHIHAAAIFTVAAAFLLAAGARATETAGPGTQKIEPVLVSGEQPGPGLWKVSKGDHVLWIMATQSPVPKGMTFRAKALEAVVAESAEILGEPAIRVSMSKVGWFRALTLIPSAMDARKNPGEATLKDLVAPPLYKRWEVLRDRYIPESFAPDSELERWRPMFAAFELYGKAIDRSGMSTRSPVWPVIEAAAKRHGVKVRAVEYEPELGNLRAAVNEFSERQVADMDCFTKTVERIETDLAAMRLRANAWARGDIAEIRRLAGPDQRAACEAVIREVSLLRALPRVDLRAEMDRLWLAAAEEALARNKATLAVLPIRHVLDADGYLARLKARGYAVEAPDDED